MKIIAMVPARLGSQRLKQKNLQIFQGNSLIAHAIKKIKQTEVFDEIWVNTESELIGKVAKEENVFFHKRPNNLADDNATSEDFIYEFLKNNDCDFIVQIHSIAPLLTKKEIIDFTKELALNKSDIILGVEKIQIECVYDNKPINFNFSSKTNSQDLNPIYRISWSISAWRKSNFIRNYELGKCATYSGSVNYFELNQFSSHVIKTKRDLDIANALYNISLNENH